MPIFCNKKISNVEKKMINFFKENWPVIPIVFILFLCVFGVFKSCSMWSVANSTCSPFVVIGEVYYKGKRIIVCDSVEGPVFREAKEQ